MYYPIIDKYTLWDNLPQYILIFIILILLSIFITIKLSFPFWNVQPVYHSYDFWRTLYSKPFLIYRRFSTKMRTKYCQLEQVEIVPYVDATETHKTDFVNLLQCYYLPSENSIYLFHLENLESYMSGHMFSTYLSFYRENHYTKITAENEESAIVQSKQPIACISSRSGELRIMGHTESIYYLDFICVKRDHDVRGLSRKLLETHIYKQQFLDKMNAVENPIMATLFRKDRELLSGIVPLVRFSTQYYELPSPKIHNYFLENFPPHFLLVEIGESNKNILLDFMGKYIHKFSFCGITDIGNMLELIRANVFYVYCLKRIDEIYAVYFYKDTRILYDEVGLSGGGLQLCASIQNTNSGQLFSNGMKHSVGSILKKMPVYKLLMVDELSDNSMMDFVGNFRKITETMGAYYLYNMVVPYSPVLGSQTFILF